MKWQINKFITARREHNGLTVRHKITICLAVLASAVALTACGSAESADAETSVSSLIEKIPDDDPTRQEYLNQSGEATSEDSTAMSDSTVSDIVDADTSSAMNLYEQFLNDEAKVLIRLDKVQNYDSYFEFNIKDGDECTLSELMAAVTKNDQNQGMAYAYMDCGNDGFPELAVRTESGDETFSWWEYWIIKDIDGSLECIYARETWPRSSIIINQYGLINGYGASGAAYHTIDQRYLDATGSIRYIFTRDAIGFPANTDGYGTLLDYNILPPDAVVYDADTDITEDLEEDDSYEEEQRAFQFYRYDFDNTQDNYMNDACSYEEQDLTNTEDDGDDLQYGYLSTDIDESILADDYPLKVQLVNAGLQIYRPAEINEMIDMQHNYYGITQEILDAPELEWTTLGAQ